MQFRPWTMFLPRPSLGLAESTPSAAVSASAAGGSVSAPCPTPPASGSVPGTASVKLTSRVPGQVILGVYPLDAPLGVCCADERTISHTILAEWRDGVLAVCPGQVSQRWITQIQPARDRTEQNIEATRDSGGAVVLRTMRPISKGEHLYVWYSDSLAREAGIPPLTPEHIRGDRQYSCVRCPRTFEYPNSLKAHLRFHCPVRRQTATHLPPSGLSLSPAFQERRRRTVLDVPRRDSGPSPRHRARSPTSPSASTPSGPTDLRIGVASAFRPHRRSTEIPEEPRPGSHQATVLVSPPRGESPREHADDKRSEPSPRVMGRTASGPSREDTEKLTMRGASSSSTVHPIQIFNHIHPPAYPMPFDHNALKYYYPLLGRFPNNGQLCYSPMPTSPYLPGGLIDPSSMYNMHPYGLQRLVPVPQDRERMEAQAKRVSPPAQEGPLHMSPQPVHMNFPIPSEKAGEPLDLLPRSLYMNKSRKGHLCIYCGKLYSRKYGLKIHLRTHTGYKPLKCKVCLRPFGDPSNLNKHIRLHAEGDTPYRCEYCGKVLVRRRDLERHIKSRHPSEAEKLESNKFGVSMDTSEEGCSSLGDLGTLGDDEDEDDIDVDSESREDPDEDREEEEDDELDEIEVVA